MSQLTPHEIRIHPRKGVAAPDGITPTVRRTADLGIGMLSFSSRAFRSAVDRFVPGGGVEDRRSPSVIRQLGRAATGVALVAEERSLHLAESVERISQRSVDTARRVPLVRDVLVGVDASITRWSERGDAERARRESALSEFVAQLVPALVAAIDRIDFAAVAARLPVADIVRAIDLNGIIQAVDLNQLLATVDVDAMLTRIDVDALMGRIDVDALMGRVDMEALLHRIDLGPIVNDVLDEVDVGGIVRESTGSITGDAVDGARLTAMRLDGFVGRVADRILLRGAHVRTAPAETPAETPADDPSDV